MGGIRSIKDLCHLNLSVTYKYFWMTSLKAILPLLHPEVWMATLDLQDAFFHITIIPLLRKCICASR